jgi:tetratricopeptide (TPR) repeat protein
VSREIKDLQRQIKELTKQATKQNSTDEIAKLNEIINQLNDFAKNIKTPPTDSSQREVIQNFRDGQYWEIINGIRAKIEFPRQVKNLEKEILKVEKKMKQKAYQVAISEFPSIKEKLDEIKAAINEAKANFEAGDLEEALQSLRFQEDIHSGDINCVLDFLPYIYNRTKKLKDGEIKQAIEDILNELFEMIRQGDFREACQGFNNIRPELEKIMQAALSSRQTINPAMQAKIDKLQSLFNRDSATSAPTKPEIAP